MVRAVAIKEIETAAWGVLNMSVGIDGEEVAVGRPSGLGLEALAGGVCEAVLVAGDGVDIGARRDEILRKAVGGIVARYAAGGGGCASDGGVGGSRARYPVSRWLSRWNFCIHLRYCCSCRCRYSCSVREHNSYGVSYAHCGGARHGRL